MGILKALSRAGTSILLAGAILVALAASALAASDFFSPVDESGALGGAASAPAAPMIERSRLVRLNLALLQTPDSPSGASAVTGALNFNVFPGVDIPVAGLTAQPRNAIGGQAWRGSVDGSPESSVTFALTNGVAAGLIRAQDGRLYEVDYVRDDLYLIKQIDMNAYPPEKAPVLPPSGGAESSTSQGRPDASGANADSGALIDVLVVYTQLALTTAGGASAMTSKISLAESETNQGYANSGVVQRIRIVHTAQVTYDESAGFDQALVDLAGKTDGEMDEVHTLRDAYGADLVSLFIVNEDYCGLAYMLDSSYLSPSTDFAPLAFSVIGLSCATGYYSFAHEMGHNQGCEHDRANGTAGVYSYSYGYQYVNADASKSWRTIMAYNCASGCSRLNYWSNPNVSYQGNPMGVDVSSPSSAYNALSLNNTRVMTANWRQTVVPVVTPVVPVSGAAGIVVFVGLLLMTRLWRRHGAARKGESA
jgi:hypothetical protein